jgi:hypothetical protein
MNDPCKGEGATHWACDCQINRMAELEVKLASIPEFVRTLWPTEKGDLGSGVTFSTVTAEAIDLFIQGKEHLPWEFIRGRQIQENLKREERVKYLEAIREAAMDLQNVIQLGYDIQGMSDVLQEKLDAYTKNPEGRSEGVE